MSSSDYNICPGCGAHLPSPAKTGKGEDQKICSYCNSIIDRQDTGRTGKKEESRILKKLLILPGRKGRIALTIILASLTTLLIMLLVYLPKEERFVIPGISPDHKNLRKGRASVNGKYSGLIQVIKCHRDGKSYGTFHDYGYWGGGRWCGQDGKAGYWVWIYPYWYIWENADKDNAASWDPSVNGKYANLIQVLSCPEDRKKYGLYRDYGYWKGGSWCGETGKTGYWVWIAPKWYVWEVKKKYGEED